MNLSRRNFILGTASLLAAPAIVRVENIMPIFVPKPPAPSVMTNLEIAQAALDRMVIWTQAQRMAALDIIASDVLVYGISLYRHEPNGEIRVFNPFAYDPSKHGPVERFISA